MSGIVQGLIASLKSAAAATTDTYFNLVTLLLNTTSTNGAQNNTFQDSSSNGFTITRAPATGPNAPTQGTFTPFSQTGWSNFFDGTDDYLAIADNALLRFGAGAFTLEAWIWRNASGAAHTIYAKGGASTGIVFQVTSTNVLRFTHTTTNIDSTGTISANSWTHVAVVREGTGTNQTKLYINGTQDGQGTVSTDFTQTEQVRIGTDRGATADFNGYISNLRFVKGTALYTATFTPSTTPLTTTSQGATATEVELLTCQSNQFLDNSSNAFSITVTGTPSVQAFEPFAPGSEYSTSAVGGSGYFDGTGDYLAFPTSNATLLPSTGQFTFELWFYCSSTTFQTLFSYGSSAGNLRVFIQDGGLQIWNGSSQLTAGNLTLIKYRGWNHAVIQRNATNLVTYVNGTRDYNTANSTNFSGGSLQVAAEVGSSLFTGYISGFSYIKGSATYSGTTITLPTAPPSPTGTTACLNFTNFGIYDASAKNDLETVGNAQVSTTQAKFGTTSMSFDGTGDYLLMPSTVTNRFGSANWTIELWFRAAAIGARQVLISMNSVAAGYGACNVNLLANGKIGLQISETGTTWKFDDTTTGLGTALSATTWYYLAVTRSGATVTVYINGSSIGTYTLTSATQTLMTNDTRNVLGINPDLTNQPFNGFLDEVRVTRGVARTITTPTDAFIIQ
jgi:hypothetical protein